MGALAIAEKAVTKLRGDVRTAMIRRNLNASFGTSQGIAVIPSGNDVTGQASLEADHQWKYVGNGRGPGRRPPLAPLRAWIADRGLTMSEYALANKIAREGSRDWRLKNKNVFLESIGTWEGKDVPAAEEEFAADVERRALEVIDSVKFN